MKRKRTGRRYLAGVLGSVMLLTSVLGNAAIASEDILIPEDAAAMEAMEEGSAAGISEDAVLIPAAQPEDMTGAAPAQTPEEAQTTGSGTQTEERSREGSQTVGSDVQGEAPGTGTLPEETAGSGASTEGTTGSQTTGSQTTGTQVTEGAGTLPEGTKGAETQTEPAPESETVEEKETRSIQTVVDGTTITMSGPQSSFPAGTNYEIRASKLSASEEEAVKEALEKKAVESQTNISSYQAFDIKLVVDGAEVQPTGAVSVTFTGAEVADTVAGSDAVQVFHVDEKTEEVNDIQSEKISDTEVVMETTHFSTYVIVNTSSKKIDVTVEHYLSAEEGKAADEKQKLFRTGSYEVEEDSMLKDFAVESQDKDGNDYYRVEKIKQIVGEEELDITGEFKNGTELKVFSASDGVTLRVYYGMGKGSYQNETTFFDYVDGRSWETKSINYEGNYPSGSKKENRIGTMGARDDYKLMTTQTVVVNGKSITQTFNANAYARIGQSGDGKGKNYTADKNVLKDYKSNFEYSWPILKGLINGLSGSNYETVNFANAEPGFFSADSKNGKTIYESYKLTFERVGNRYTLKTVSDAAGKEVCNNPNSFFPLNSVNGGNKNEYFGMRYDFKFKTGDYLGDMEYRFTGDDDLWVFVDGKVVLDLGGIHGAYTGNEYNEITNSLWKNSVDIWEVLTGKTDYTEEDKMNVAKDEEHTVTVLFMERGGNASNCYMEFVMPEVFAKDPVITTTPKANLTFTKKDQDGAALEGAAFQLTAGNNVYSATSQKDGSVTFANLSEGEYTLTETQAPTGYVKNSKSWTVKVEVTGETATATLYDGNTAINEIKNTAIEKVIKNDKTAEVVNEADRVFKINLNASSLDTVVTEGSRKAVDIVLVLDASGSMCEYSGTLSGDEISISQLGWNQYGYFEINGTLYRVNRWKDVEKENKSSSGDQKWEPASVWSVPATVHTDFVSRMEALKASAHEFVDLLKEKSPESRVGIAAYSNENDLVASLGLTMVGTGATTIKNTIDSLEPKEWTYAYLGLNKAGAYLKNSTNEKVVVLLSDGADNGSIEYDRRGNVSKDTTAGTAASTLKDDGVNIYTVGFKVNTETENNLKAWSSGEGYYFGANDMESLVNSFKLIVEGTVTGTIITGATIVDYIDPRFDVTDQNGNKLSEGAEVNGGTLHKDGNGNWYVEWTSDIAPEGSTPGWTGEIYVKAKPDFMGGNAVPTNGNAYISFNGNSVPFPKPTVNVALLKLAAEDKETTVFIKDTIEPEKLVKELEATLKADGKEIPAGCRLTANEWATLLEKGTVQKPYIYPGTTDRVGTFTYTYEPVTGKTESHQAETVGDEVEEYELSVTYEARSVTDRTEAGFQAPAVNAGTEVGKVDATATYLVNVVAGSVDITKTIDGDWNVATEGDPIFTFKITRTNGDVTETFYRTIRFGEGTGDTLSAEILKDLPRGTYTVTELDTQRYDEVTVANKSASDEKKVVGAVANENKAISFKIGVGENAQDFNKLNGYALFTNKKTDGGKRTDTDVMMNRYYYENGAWHISQEKVPQTPKVDGNVSSKMAYLVPDKKKGVGGLSEDEQNPEELM